MMNPRCFALILLATACADDGSETAAGHTCEADAQQDCACPSDRSACVRTCASDGSARDGDATLEVLDHRGVLNGFYSLLPMKLYTYGAVMDALPEGRPFEILWDDFELRTGAATN